MMMSRVSYRERQPGGSSASCKSVIRNFRVFDRRWPPVFATLFCYRGTSDFGGRFPAAVI